MKQINLSAVVLTKNSEKRIKECLDSLLEISKEIVIVDDNSTDKTIEIAKKYTNKIYKRSLNNDFSSQKQFGLNKTNNEWVLFLDSDEIVNEKLKRSILNQLKVDNKYDGFYIKREEMFLNKKLNFGESGKYILRLAKKSNCTWKGTVHERLYVKGNLSKIDGEIVHQSFENIKEMINKINFYTNILANEKHQNGQKSNLFKIVIFPIAKFMENYIFRFGFLDGTHGLVSAILMSFHSFLTWSKLYTTTK